MKYIAIILAVVVLCVFAQQPQYSNYSYDGSGNNVANPNWGQQGQALIRICGPKYQDGVSVPAGGFPQSNYPSPRLISNLVFARIPAGLRPRNPRMLSDALTFWGQFVAHDLDNSPDSLSTGCNHFDIPIPSGDSFFDPTSTGTQTMTFCRTVPVPNTGTAANNPLQQPNQITAWFDGSSVYGSNTAWNTALRTFQGGLLKTQPGPDGPLLPFNNNGNGSVLIPGGSMANPAKRVPITAIFAAGDARANENPALASLHTLFVREHNRRAALLPSSWTDEQIFQTARKFVIAHLQHITFYEYLPALTGQTTPPYPGYNSTLNPQIYSVFSTAAFRYGHDEISGVMYRYDPNGLPDLYGNTIVRDNYFWPAAITNTTGIGAYLRGLAVNPQNAVDGMIDEDMRTFLFALPPGSATDLAARNIQRGRDHGLCRYNDYRVAYGLQPCSNWSCVSSDPLVQNQLSLAYGPNGVANLDVYVGGLLEDRANTTNLGPLFTAIITEQLYRIRAADAFWFENPGQFSASDLNEIQTTTFSDIILRNSDTSTLPSNVFTRSNEAPAVELGATAPTNTTPWIIAVVVLAVVAGILLIVVIGLCISRPKSGAKKDDNLYENLLESK